MDQNINITDIEEAIVRYMSNEDIDKWMRDFFASRDNIPYGWHPDMTEAQYLSALSRGIDEPVGREYEMFLFEHGLEPVKEKIVSPPPKPPLPPKPPINPPTDDRKNFFEKLKMLLERIRSDRENNRGIPGREFGGLATLVDLKERYAKLPKEDRERINPEDIPVDFGKLNIPRYRGIDEEKELDDKEKYPRIREPKEKEDEEIIKPEPKELTNNNQDEDIVLGVRMDTRRKEPDILAALGKILPFLLSGSILISSILGNPRVYDTILKYDIDSYQVKQVFSYIEHEENVYVQDVTMGEYYDIYNGFTFHSNSLGGREKTMGVEFSEEGKYEGSYRVTGFSITDLEGNEIYSFNQDFDAEDDYTVLSEWVNGVLEQENMNIEDIRIVIHFGHNKTADLPNTRLGWIDIKDFYQREMVTEEEITEKIEQVSVESGTLTNFEGDTITLGNGVDIKIKDENGNYLAEGTHVIGSDGEEYVIKGLSQAEELNKGKTTLNYAIKCAGLAASAAIAFAAIKGLGAKKDEKENEDEKDFEPSIKFKTYENQEEFNADMAEIDKINKENEKSSIVTDIRKLAPNEVNKFKRIEQKQEALEANKKQLSPQEVEKLFNQYNEMMANIGKDNPVYKSVHGEVELEDEFVIKK